MTEDDNNSEKIRGRPFHKGESGNPNGRPKGSRNRLTSKLEELAFSNVEEVFKKIIEQALSGDHFAQKLCLDWLLPKYLERPVSIDLPPLRSAADIDDAMQTVIGAVASGDLTPREGETIRALLEFRLNTLEARDWEQRLQVIVEWVASES